MNNVDFKVSQAIHTAFDMDPSIRLSEELRVYNMIEDLMDQLLCLDLKIAYYDFQNITL